SLATISVAALLAQDETGKIAIKGREPPESTAWHSTQGFRAAIVPEGPQYREGNCMTVPPQDCKTPMPSDKPPPRQHSLRTRIIHLMAGDHCINRLKITGSLLARTEYEIQLSHEQEILSRLMKKRHDLPTILVMIRTLMSNLSHEN